MRQQARSRRAVLGAAVAAGRGPPGRAARGPRRGRGPAPPAGLTAGVRVSFAVPAPPDQRRWRRGRPRRWRSGSPGSPPSSSTPWARTTPTRSPPPWPAGRRSTSSPSTRWSWSPSRTGGGCGRSTTCSGGTATTWPTSSACFDQYRWQGRGYALPLELRQPGRLLQHGAVGRRRPHPPPLRLDGAGLDGGGVPRRARRLARLPAGPVGPGRSTGGAPRRQRGGPEAGVWGWSQGTGLREWAPWVWIFGGDVLDQGGRAVRPGPGAGGRGAAVPAGPDPQAPGHAAPGGPGEPRRGAGQRPAGDGAGHPGPRGAPAPGPGAGVRRRAAAGGRRG